MDRFGEADRVVAESRNDDALKTLKALEAAGPVDAELLWRLARANYLVGESSEGEAAKELFYKAHELAQRAVKESEAHGQIQKWMAITIGKLGEFSDTKSKIENSYCIKEHALRAQELMPEDATVAHILGRWCFGVAGISFIERGIASALFASPPVSTYEEALVHFQRHEELLKDKGGGMVRNKIFIGDSLLKLDRKTEAAEWFLKASKCEVKTESDRKFVQEAVTKHASATATGWW